jgi:hypothetical protein
MQTYIITLVLNDGREVVVDLNPLLAYLNAMSGSTSEDLIHRSLSLIGRMFQEMAGEPDQLSDTTLQLGILLLRNTRVL